MFYKEIIEQTGPGSAFLEQLEAQILKNLLLRGNHGGAFVGSMYVPVCPQKTLDMSMHGPEVNNAVMQLLEPHFFLVSLVSVFF